jgi:hypothetical protein
MVHPSRHGFGRASPARSPPRFGAPADIDATAKQLKEGLGGMVPKVLRYKDFHISSMIGA